MNVIMRRRVQGVSISGEPIETILRYNIEVPDYLSASSDEESEDSEVEEVAENEFAIDQDGYLVPTDASDSESGEIAIDGGKQIDSLIKSESRETI